MITSGFRSDSQSVARRHQFISGLVSVVIVATFAVVAAACDGASTPTSAGSGGTALHVMLSNDRVRITSVADMCTTLLVADGVVLDYGQGRWNTLDGTRPPGLDETAILRQGYAIETPLNLTAMATDRDRRSTATRQFVVVGGIVGSDTWQDMSLPFPRPGTRIVGVFVPAQRPNGAFSYDTLELFEAFPVNGDVVTLLPQTVEQGQVSQAAVTIKLEDLRKALASC